MFQFIIKAFASSVLAVSNAMLSLPYVGRFIDVLLALGCSTVRIGAGGFVASGLESCKRPKKLLQLYEYEGCPFCRRVRETLTILDLDAEIFPTPRETFKEYGYANESRFRPAVLKHGGKCQFPFLVDPNNNIKMYESLEIVKYLWDTYGDKASPSLFDRLANLPGLSAGLFLAGAFRMLPHHGLLRTPSAYPAKKLELYSAENSPFCRIAREALSTLELPYVLKNCAHGANRNRVEFQSKFSSHLSNSRKSIGKLLGKTIVKIPFLVDPNTGVMMSESADIVKYLNDTYKTGRTVNETFMNYTAKGATEGHMKVL